MVVGASRRSRRRSAGRPASPRRWWRWPRGRAPPQSRPGGAANTVKALPGAPAKAAVIGRPVSANSCIQPSLNPRSSFLSSPMPMEPARSAPMVVRCELVVCCATLRLSECAPDSLNAILRHARDLEAAERRDAGGSRRIDVDLVAGLDLAEELVGAGAAGGDALVQAGDQDLAPQLVVVIGVARERIDVKASLRERAVGRDAHAVGASPGP